MSYDRKLPDIIKAERARTLIHISGDGIGIAAISVSANHVHEDEPGDKRRYIARQESIAAEIVRRWNGHSEMLALLIEAEKKMTDCPAFNAWDLGAMPILVKVREAIKNMKGEA